METTALYRGSYRPQYTIVLICLVYKGSMRLGGLVSIASNLSQILAGSMGGRHVAWFSPGAASKVCTEAADADPSGFRVRV